MCLDNYKLHIGAKIGPIYFYCKCLIFFAFDEYFFFLVINTPQMQSVEFNLL